MNFHRGEQKAGAFSERGSGWGHGWLVRNSIAGSKKSHSAAPSAAATIHAVLVVYAGAEQIFVSSPYQHSSFSFDLPLCRCSVFVIVETAPSCKLGKYIPIPCFRANEALRK